MKIISLINKSIAGMRNAYLVNLLAIVNIALSLTLFGGFVVSIINANLFVERLGNRLEVVAYLKDGISEESLNELQEELKRYPEVRGIAFISKEEALASLDKGLAGEPSILDSLDVNPLPASLIIKLNDAFQNPAGIKGVTERLGKSDSIEDLQYGGEWIKKISVFVSMVRFGGVLFGIVIILSTLVIVSNTIWLTIQTRVDEIEGMRLAGATPLFIKAPFFIEGIIIGGIGSAFAVGLLAAAKSLIGYNFGNDLKLLFGFNLDMLPYQAVIIILLFGMGFGLIGSIISLWRFPRN
ncbi:MAG: ABC transporter permease [Deltaproteobacteria bacterium]|nr:ABC transporter permease [Deltaproteobacteria bacterium]